MKQGAEVLHNPWMLRSVLATHRLTHTGNGPKPQLDLPAPMYCAPAPWEAPQRTSLMSLCTTTDLQQHGLMAMTLVTKPGCVIYYSDNKVNPHSGRTGTAAITDGTKLCARTPDYHSTLQTELVAIQLALEHTQHCQVATVVLHTDSRTRLKLQPSDNAGCVTTILGSLQSFTTQGRRVKLNWILAMRLLTLLLGGPLRVPRPAQPAPDKPHDGGLLTRCEARAAFLVHHMPLAMMLQVLQDAPPPH
ncbi:hypothetical protein E2C01_042637 [Portunus trituberculatus]|uniref:RNase H type-1 domain-containing protein n=1 Tax=Portunus trituberculatus TaxID=210409 RepID=A0A5B7FQR3_PORTR|nr:hypothetical protein [Portunus trituberculatus]